MQHLIIVFRHRHVHDAEIGVGVAIVFLVVYLDGRIVAQFVGAHSLQVHLHGAHTHPLADSLAVVQGIGARVDQVVERPALVGVAKAVVDGLVSYQCILVGRHFVRGFICFLTNIA